MPLQVLLLIMKFNLILIAAAFIAALFSSCGDSDSDKKEEKTEVNVPVFSADSAYVYIERQFMFGPRVPATPAHDSCLSWMVESFRVFNADTVIVQRGEVKLYDGSTKPLANVIASYNLQASSRILLCSHWDSRPFADQDVNPATRKTPIAGVDDGASGVGVLLEVARHLGEQMPNIGVDIIFFDLEDWGAPEWENRSASADNGWCLGSQYWSKNKHEMGYSAQFGILLDMVGGADTKFYREYFSDMGAKWVNDKVWGMAHELNMDDRFVSREGGAITDDHMAVMKFGGIPCIDIVAYNPQNNSGFPVYWHTHNDDMRNISRATLNDVGTLLLHIIYR